MTESWMGVKEASTAQTSETFDRVQARQSEHYGGETRATKGACLDVMSRYVCQVSRAVSAAKRGERKSGIYVRYFYSSLMYDKHSLGMTRCMHAVPHAVEYNFRLTGKVLKM